jgi:periplasmic protein TonB
MFSTLESNWDNSAHRGRAALVSFTLQLFGLSLLVAISMLWVERPPQVHWLQISAPSPYAPRVEAQPANGNHSPSTGGAHSLQIFRPLNVSPETVRINDAPAGPSIADAPSIDGPSIASPIGIRQSFGSGFPVVIPPRPALVKPLLVSHWAEGNLIFRVQPVYPPLAKLARIQGPVEMRAIISKTGAIENLTVDSGHPMLAASAVEAVRQWRYRPYLLNNEPIEVETEITVNFVLSGK